MSFDPGEALAPSLGMIDLSHTLEVGMARSPRHPEFHHSLVRRHGDAYREDGSSSANDLISMGTHVGTHVDALGHFSCNDKLFGGIPALEAQRGGRLSVHDAAAIPTFYHRGVVLDIAASLGVERCPAGYEVTVDDLEAAQARAGVKIQAADVILIATGWSSLFEADREAYVGWHTGAPGIGIEAARWLLEREVAAVGGETLALEQIPVGEGHARLPVHELFLVEHGIYIFECMKLDDLCASGVSVFTFIAAPLKIRGATGAPVRPIALLNITQPAAS